MTTELLQQVRVIDPVSGIDNITDVLIADGVIQAIAPNIPNTRPDTQIRDCRGLVLGPGLVDLYSHSGEPGFEERETLASFLQAAAAGGFTKVSILPDTSPAIDNPALVAQLQKRGQGAGGEIPNPQSPIPSTPALYLGCYDSGCGWEADDRIG